LSSELRQGIAFMGSSKFTKSNRIKSLSDFPGPSPGRDWYGFRDPLPAPPMQHTAETYTPFTR